MSKIIKQDHAALSSMLKMQSLFGWKKRGGRGGRQKNNLTHTCIRRNAPKEDCRLLPWSFAITRWTAHFTLWFE